MEANARVLFALRRTLENKLSSLIFSSSNEVLSVLNASGRSAPCPTTLHSGPRPEKTLEKSFGLYRERKSTNVSTENVNKLSFFDNLSLKLSLNLSLLLYTPKHYGAKKPYSYNTNPKPKSYTIFSDREAHRTQAWARLGGDLDNGQASTLT